MDNPNDSSFIGFLKDNVWTAVITFIGSAGGFLSYLQFMRERKRHQIGEKRDLYKLLDEIKLKNLEDVQELMSNIEELQERVREQQEYIATLRLTLKENGIEIPPMPILKPFHRIKNDSARESTENS